MIFPFKSRQGQAGLEYMALAAFVIAGIIIGGPYVVRSINSHFKTVEEGAIDADREVITEHSGEVTLPDCDCTTLLDHGCGDGVTAHDGVVCTPLQKVFARTCLPTGCESSLMGMHVFDKMSECRDDLTNTCCTTAAPGVCAQDPGRYSPSSPPVCANGQREYIQQCGSPTAITKVTCQPDVLCDYQCQLLDAHATWCNPSTYNVGLTAPNVPVKYQNAGGCTGHEYCEAQCATGYEAASGGCNKICGNGVCDDGNEGRPNHAENCSNCPEECCSWTGGSCSECPWGYYQFGTNDGTPLYGCNLHGYWGAWGQVGVMLTHYTKVNKYDFPHYGFEMGAWCTLLSYGLSWKITVPPVVQSCMGGPVFWGYCTNW